MISNSFQILHLACTVRSILDKSTAYLILVDSAASRTCTAELYERYFVLLLSILLFSHRTHEAMS